MLANVFLVPSPSILKGSAIVGEDDSNIFGTLPLFPCETGSGTALPHPCLVMSQVLTRTTRLQEGRGVFASGEPYCRE